MLIHRDQFLFIEWLRVINPVTDLWFVDSGISLWLLSLQVHEHLPIYTAGIQEFQNRLDHLQIEQAKLADMLASDKRYSGIKFFMVTSWLCVVWTLTSCLSQLSEDADAAAEDNGNSSALS